MESLNYLLLWMEQMGLIGIWILLYTKGLCRVMATMVVEATPKPTISIVTGEVILNMRQGALRTMDHLYMKNTTTEAQLTLGMRVRRRMEDLTD